MTRPYTSRSRFLPLYALIGAVLLSTLATSRPTIAATPAQSFAGLLYFQKESAEDAAELALDSSTKTPLLDEIPSYAAGVAQQISLDQQHTIYFKVGSNVFPLTIKQINSDGITAQIASGMDTQIQPGHTGSYDADRDNHDDIAITLNTINDDAAHLTIRKLPQEAAPVATVGMTPFVSFKWALLVVVFAVLVAVIVMRTRQARAKKR